MDRLEAQNNQNSQLQNPYTLVYKGAIVENLEGKVNIHPVTYNNKDIVIVANVYTPANFDASKKYATIVIAHPNGGVKEQVAGLYAQRLAEMGFITITADVLIKEEAVANLAILINQLIGLKIFMLWQTLSPNTKVLMFLDLDYLGFAAAVAML